MHRSDSMDHILERLNYSSSRITDDSMNNRFTDSQVSALINTRNLKLHDINKEIEYNQSSRSVGQVAYILPILWSSVILFAGLLLFKIVNSIIESRYTQKETVTASDTIGSQV